MDSPVTWNKPDIQALEQREATGDSAHACHCAVSLNAAPGTQLPSGGLQGKPALLKLSFS